MAFTIQEFVRSRPYLYHLTARTNSARIKRTNTLDPTAAILKASGNLKMLTARRPTALHVNVNGDAIHVRDQHPLHAGNVDFRGKWTIDKLVQEINEMVFFWPGSADWVTSYALRHYQRYAFEKPVVLRMSLAAVIHANCGIDPLFCKYNSGSPRWNSGNASPRGPDTFVTCAKASFRPPGAVEVTFRSSVRLPSGVEVADSYNGKWRPL
jgi:hypothetical protein